MVNATGTTHKYASRLGIKEGWLIQEVSWDTDCDSVVSEPIENPLDADLFDEDTDKVVDVVLLWWREEDGDLVDDPVGASRPSEDEDRVWLFTPGTGQLGVIDPGMIDESAQLTGFSDTSALRLGDWQGNCLIRHSS